MANEQGRPSGWTPGDATAKLDGDDPIVPPSTIPIEYRQSPEYLTSAQVVAELLWLAEAVSWRCTLGVYARDRAHALRIELRRREGAAA